MRGVKMVVEQGCTQARVAEILGVGERQVRRWMKRYRRGGYRALAKQTRGRRATEQMALTARQQDKLVKMIKSKHPEQLRIPGTLWTRAGVGDLIERECGVRLEITTVGRYIERWGFTLKRPTKRMLEADPEVVEAWLSEVYPQIKARAARARADLLAGRVRHPPAAADAAGRLCPEGPARGGARLGQARERKHG